MEAKVKTQTQKITQNVNLVKGSFTSSEAAFIVGALIDQKINFHNIQWLQTWEGDHCHDSEAREKRIDELKDQKRMAEEFVLSRAADDVCFKIKGSLEITVENKEAQ